MTLSHDAYSKLLKYVRSFISVDIFIDTPVFLGQLFV